MVVLLCFANNLQHPNCSRECQARRILDNSAFVNNIQISTKQASDYRIRSPAYGSAVDVRLNVSRETFKFITLSFKNPLIYHLYCAIIIRKKEGCEWER